MKKFMILSTSVALATALALSGCGGGGSADSSEGITISGKAIDPYLSGSKVCLDLNTNRVCDVNEPYTTTNDVGDYALEIAQEHHNAAHSLLVTGGTDIGTGEPFTGTLTAVKEAHQRAHNITPLTTAVEARYQYCQTHDQCHETVTEIEESLATYLELTVADINGDIVALANSGHEVPLTTALALYNAAVTHNPDNPYAAYQEVAQYGFPAGHNWQDDLRTLMPKSYRLVAAIMSIDEGVLENAATDAANAGVNAGETAANVGVEVGTDAANAGVQAGEDAANAGVEAGVEAHSIAHQIAQYVHGLVHQTATDAENTGVQAGEDAHDTAHETATEASETTTDAHDTAHETAEDAHDVAHETVEEVTTPINPLRL